MGIRTHVAACGRGGWIDKQTGDRSTSVTWVCVLEWAGVDRHKWAISSPLPHVTTTCTTKRTGRKVFVHKSDIWNTFARWLCLIPHSCSLVATTRVRTSVWQLSTIGERRTPSIVFVTFAVARVKSTKSRSDTTYFSFLNTWIICDELCICTFSKCYSVFLITRIVTE